MRDRQVVEAFHERDDTRRDAEALRIAQISLRLDPRSEYTRGMVEEVKRHGKLK
jgi:hypothetical protein